MEMEGSSSDNENRTPSMADFHALYEQLQQVMNQNAGLQAQLNSMHTTPSTATPQTTAHDNTNTIIPARRRLPDPAPFDGETSTSFHHALMTLRNKVALDGPVIGSESDQVKYCMTRLTGKAAKQMVPWAMKYEGTPQFTLQEFFAKMTHCFSDPQQSEKALRRLRTLKQGDKGFNKYLQEFEHLLLEAGGSEWDDMVKKNYLDGGLNDVMTDAILGAFNLPADFREYCNALGVVGDRIAARRYQKSSIGIKGSNNHGNASRQSFLANNTVPSTITTHKEVTNATGRGGSPDAMDWTKTNAGTRAKWVSQKELDARRAAHACFRCGNTGHIVKNCPLLPAIRPARVNVTQVKNVMRAADETDDKSDVSSESELKE